MRNVITNCHTCHLAGLDMPAVFASADGDFYCDNCRKVEGLEPAQLISIAEYLAMKGLNHPAPAAGSAAPNIKDEGHVTKPQQEIEMTVAKVTGHIWCQKCRKIKVRASSKTGECTPCMRGMSATNPKRLALEARDAGEPITDLTQKKRDKAMKKTKAPKPLDTEPEAQARKVVAIALELDEEQLDAWWTGLPFETRGVLFQHYFHGVQA